MNAKVVILIIGVLFHIGLYAAQKEYPFYFKHTSTQSDQNHVQILHSGIASLQKRIDLIRKAKKRISLEYFIWEKDTAGLLVFNELIKKAQEGVDVRIIVDKSITVIEMDEFYAEILDKHDVKVRYYNRALDPATAQLRTHRKILVIDGNEGITGGRNIGDDYFDLDEVYSFLDRDIYFSGKTALAMQDSFDIFWDDDIINRPTIIRSNPNSRRLFRDSDSRRRNNYHNRREDQFEEQRTEAQQWFDKRDEMNSVADEIEKIARPILEGYPVIDCPTLTYVSDLPGMKASSGVVTEFSDYRLLKSVLFEYIRQRTRGTYYLASPYFMLNEDWQALLSEVIAKRKVNTVLYTNSLGSTDAFYVASNFYRIIFSWQNFGLTPWIHNSRYNDYEAVFSEEVEKARWGMHEKTHVFNDESFFIGTYNIDNRSDNLNVEMGLFCDGSKELTQNLVNDMKIRYEAGYKIVGDEQAVDSKGNIVDVYGNASKGQIFLMKSTSPVSRVFEPLMSVDE